MSDGTPELFVGDPGMRVENLTLTKLRCFGPEPTPVPLHAELTTVVGPNGAGKTAPLQAQMRLFGVTRAQRTIVPADFLIVIPFAERFAAISQAGKGLPRDSAMKSSRSVAGIPRSAASSRTGREAFCIRPRRMLGSWNCGSGDAGCKKDASVAHLQSLTVSRSSPSSGGSFKAKDSRYFSRATLGLACRESRFTLSVGRESCLIGADASGSRRVLGWPRAKRSARRMRNSTSKRNRRRRHTENEQ
jgi:hypothetical protein